MQFGLLGVRSSSEINASQSLMLRESMNDRDIIPEAASVSGSDVSPLAPREDFVGTGGATSHLPHYQQQRHPQPFRAQSSATLQLGTGGMYTRPEQVSGAQARPVLGFSADSNWSNKFLLAPPRAVAQSNYLAGSDDPVNNWSFIEYAPVIVYSPSKRVTSNSARTLSRSISSHFATIQAQYADASAVGAAADSGGEQGNAAFASEFNDETDGDSAQGSVISETIASAAAAARVMQTMSRGNTMRNIPRQQPAVQHRFKSESK